MDAWRNLTIFLSLWSVLSGQAQQNPSAVATQARKETVSGVPVHSHSGPDDEVTWIAVLPQGISDNEIQVLNAVSKEHGMKPKQGIHSEGQGNNANRKRSSLAASIMQGSFRKLTGTLQSAAARGLKVHTVEEDRIINSSGAVSIKSWGLDRIDARSGLDHAFSAGSNRGQGVHIYVLDTGVRTTHKDFGGRAVPTLDTSPMPEEDGRICNPLDTACALDKDGHGTHCAATAAGDSFGIANQATIHAVKVLRDDGQGRLSAVVVAINWLAQYGQEPLVLSMSLGMEKSPVLDEFVQRAAAQNITMVVAAGNDYDDACNYSPANLRSVVTVGATDAYDRRASFSNTGACVDIFAPGVNILSAGIASDTAEASKSGTSMAAPHVSGVVALFLGQNPKLTSGEVQSLLKSTSTLGAIMGLDPVSPNKLLFFSADYLSASFSVQTTSVTLRRTISTSTTTTQTTAMQAKESTSTSGFGLVATSTLAATTQTTSTAFLGYTNLASNFHMHLHTSSFGFLLVCIFFGTVH
mmetsp:Transcript_94018/g.166487  ORF Transcript_94018/g.166487 Transcript_94018/m.166487 type:complete len:524 (-) Transcript_94018:152-1723(-)